MSNTPKTPAAAEELKAPTPGPAERDAVSDAALDDVAGGRKQQKPPQNRPRR